MGHAAAAAGRPARAQPSLPAALPLLAGLLLLLAAAAGLSLQFWQRKETRVLQQQLTALAQELRSTKQELGARFEHGQHAAGWVKDRDLAHRASARAACTSSGTAGLRLNTSEGSGLVSPLVVVAYNRVHYLAKAMVSLLGHWNADPANAAKFPLFVSIDGHHQPTLLFASALNFSSGVQTINHVRDGSCAHADNYCALGTHYRMLLSLFFECLQSPRLIFLEEDLEVAPDFFPYFTSLAPLLDADPSLLCASAWNDHGQAGRAANATQLYRTDVMPGLGWMLSAQVAAELLAHWQASGWDEYTRNPCVRKGRQCIFPEVPRTHTFGAVGNSGGLFYKEHLSNMLLNNASLDWPAMDLSYLGSDAYAGLMRHWLAHAQPLPRGARARLKEHCAVGQPPERDARDLVVTYTDHDDYQALARQLAPMLGDISVGGKVPRASYNGTVVVRCRSRRLFITRSPDAQPLDFKCGRS